LRGDDGPRGGGPPRAAEDEAARQAAKEEREKESLGELLAELTRFVSVQDAMRSLDTVSVDLKKAIKKLSKLLGKCKVRRVFVQRKTASWVYVLCARYGYAQDCGCARTHTNTAPFSCARQLQHGMHAAQEER
jgi:hypothetical protein